MKDILFNLGNYICWLVCSGLCCSYIKKRRPLIPFLIFPIQSQGHLFFSVCLGNVRELFQNKYYLWWVSMSYRNKTTMWFWNVLIIIASFNLCTDFIFDGWEVRYSGVFVNSILLTDWLVTFKWYMLISNFINNYEWGRW